MVGPNHIISRSIADSFNPQCGMTHRLMAPLVIPSTAGFKSARAAAFSSGKEKPRSHANPQQPTRSGMTTLSAHFRATARMLSPRSTTRLSLLIIGETEYPRCPSFVSMETIRSSKYLAPLFLSASRAPHTSNTSYAAVHSGTEPRAISKNFRRSASVAFPMFKGIDCDARSN